MFRYLSYAILSSIFTIVQAQESLATLSEEPYEWGSLNHYYAKDSLRCLSHAAVSSSIKENSVEIYLSWKDDVIDSRTITQDIRRWKDPEGKVRDKDLMYLYDGLGIRIFYNDLFYEGWIRPLSKDDWEVQWENAGSMKHRSSKAIDLLKFSHDQEFVKIELTLSSIEWYPTTGDTIKIVLIAADSDATEESSVKTRIASGINYCISTKEFLIKSDL